MKKWILLVAVLALPVVAWAAFKPIRIVAPQLVGVSCPTRDVCLDDAARLPEATRLYDEASRFVNAQVDRLEARPRVVFCAAEACFASFGFRHAAAKTIGTLGIVVGPRGWQPHYLRHEMIHFLQHERLGTLDVWMTKPAWFVEGVAYALSDDPRPALHEPFQTYRERFEAWYGKVGRERLWVEAEGLRKENQRH